MKTAVVFLCISAALTTYGVHSDPEKKSGSCPADWTKIEGRCFLYVQSEKPWAEAEKNCVSKGSNLASIRSANEYHELQKMIANITHGYPRTWLGGSDCQMEGLWLWSDGTRFSMHACGYFDNFFNQDCLQMNYGEHKCFDDMFCSRHLPSVCAKKIE